MMKAPRRGDTMDMIKAFIASNDGEDHAYFECASAAVCNIRVWTHLKVASSEADHFARRSGCVATHHESPK